MDNDLKIVKIIKMALKKIKFTVDYRDIDIIPEAEGNKLIAELLDGSDPAMIGRGGATELRCIGEYIRTGTFSEKIKKEISELSGVFPNDDETLKRFCSLYIECMSKADLLSLWGVGAESRVVHEYCLNSKFTELHALEPYYFKNPWSRILSGKRVLVVHPFVDSIASQYNKRTLLFKDNATLPEFKKLECVKAVQSIAGEKTEFANWFDALDYMKAEIAKHDFDIAIIGAGAYGCPLACYCKEIGKKAIQMSGATQILFGIKGKRWESIPEINKLYNENWVRPTANETPKKKEKVEGGSYW